jgi:hypothetical protein
VSLSFVTFKWQAYTGYRSTFKSEHVNVLFRMIDRHYTAPHRNICVTDDPKGITGEIEVVPLWSDHANVPNPNGGTRNPSCYRRLKLFAPDAGDQFGDRIVVMDLDTVIVGDLTGLFARPEDFVIWGQTDFPRTQWYNGSLWMLRTGTRPKVWTEFQPRTSPRMASKAGKKGSDQGWFSYILGPNEAVWTTADGIYSYRVHLSTMNWELPANAKIVAFHGHTDPWSHKAQQLPWVRSNWQ